MFQASPHSPIYLAIEPVDFRKGIDGFCGVCRQKLEQEPIEGAFFLFRNRTGKMIRILAYDGQGFWLATKRFSQGKLRWWPQSTECPSFRLSLKSFKCCSSMGTPKQRLFRKIGGHFILLPKWPHSSKEARLSDFWTPLQSVLVV